MKKYVNSKFGRCLFQTSYFTNFIVLHEKTALRPTRFAKKSIGSSVANISTLQNR